MTLIQIELSDELNKKIVIESMDKKVGDKRIVIIDSLNKHYNIK